MRPPRTLLAAALAAALTGAAAGAPALTSTALAAPGGTTAEARYMPWLTEHLAGLAADATVRVAVRATSLQAARDAAAATGLTVQQEWTSVDTVVAIGPAAGVRALGGEPGVVYVEGDQPQEYALDTAHTATRSAEALPLYTDSTGHRVDGTGITVAIIDSGIDGTHPFFQVGGTSKVVKNMKNVCGAVFVTSLNEQCFASVPTNDSDTESGGGHGTHVAGIVAGVEVTTTSPAGTKLRGAAPGAKLVGLSVGAAIGLLDANSAIQWVVDHQRFPCRTKAQQDQAAAVDPACPPIRATNHSYGPVSTSGTTYDPASPTVALQRQLVTKGVVPVWAAGNDGGDGTQRNTNPPGMDETPGVLMVASYNDAQNGARDNALSSFSSRGLDGDQRSYPDVSAPGDLITSSCRTYLSVCQGSPSYDTGNYQTISGTSMATPYVAGVVSQLFQANPALTPADVERILEDTAHKFAAGAPYEADAFSSTGTTSSFDKGHGLVDVMKALASAQGLADPGEPLTGGPSCTPDGTVLDASGDATGAAVTDETPAPSQDDLDIVRAFFSTEADGVTSHVRVTDLPTTGGQYQRFTFGYGGASYILIASRDAAGVTAFRLSVNGTTGATSIATLTGAFDDVNDEIRVVLPFATFNTAAGPATPMGLGSELSGLSVLMQRYAGALTLTSDTATGACAYLVGTEPLGEGPTPVVPEAPLALLLPLGAAAVAGLTVASRRRRVLV